LVVAPVVLALAGAAAGCGRKQPDTPAVATPTVTLTHDRVPAGSVVDVTYKWMVANDAHFDQDYRVFVHVKDLDGDQLWGDDHFPPVPTSQWKPGQTVEYTRTLFAPVFPYVGEATIEVGLHSTNPNPREQVRLTLNGENTGQHAYKVATLSLLPQTDNLFTVFKDGWHRTESPEQDALVEWQWTKKDATLAFKNPKRDAILYLDTDAPGSPYDAQQVQVTLGGQTIDTFEQKPMERTLRKVKLPAAAMGSGDMAEAHIIVDKTFVPQQASGSGDTRVLGIRVFHVFVDAR
jgi:hypothetical protein